MKHILKKLGGIFLAGILVIVPLGLTILILVWLFNTLDNILQPLILKVWGQYYTGIGIGVIIILIFVVGLIASNYLGKRLISLTETYFVRKIPVIGQLYHGIKQILGSFSRSNKNGFIRVVLVEFPRKGIKAIGFITNEVETEAGEKQYYVYIPTSPNPTGGFLQIVKEEELIWTKMSIDEALKLVVSAGKFFPEEEITSPKSDD